MGKTGKNKDGTSWGEERLRVDVVLKKSRGLIVIFLSLTLITAITTVAAAFQDYIFTYSDAAHTQPETTFGDGDTVYLTVTDNNTTGGTKTISVTNDQEANSISVSVTEGATSTVYEGSFIIHSGADEADKLHMTDGQTATISANLDGNVDPADDGATKKITADYAITALTDVIWTYSDSSRTVEETEFGDGDTVYLKVTDTETKGGTKAITVQNTTIGNTISVNVTDSNSDSFYLGSFIVYSGANDDANDKLSLFDGQSATITADLGADGTPGTKTIRAAYGAPSPTNLAATAISGGSIQLSWTPSSPETGVTQYNIYRATSLGAENYSSPTYTVSVGITSYKDSAATQGQTYYYAVRAQDAAGNTDTNTNEVSATADANYQFVKSGIGLIRGTNYIRVQSMDKAGNKSKLSKTLKFAHNPEGLLSVVFRSTHVVRRDSPIGIIYSVTQAAEIVIRVYNLNGELVKEWKGNASPGVANEWKWYGKNMYEEEVNNGVYIFRITAKASGSRESKIKLLPVVR